MTDEELKELVASNSRTITRLEGLHAENERRWQEMREEFRTSRAESERRWQETDRRWREEIHASRAELDRLVGGIHREIGSLGNKLGDYAEGLCRPALEHILRERFRMSEVALRVNSRRNGHEIELDVLGHANDRINKAYVAEIKSTLRQDGIEQILEHLRVFPDFFPQHRGKELYGILAAIDAPPEVQDKALREGLYLVLVSEDAFRLVEREGFQPRDFSG
ncbi:MAG TPA: DUF3782 domain-containing protein [Thermoanaerobaculia bacterium]|jgi:hypothetical protein